MIAAEAVEPFSGAKLALICGDALLVYRRDARDDIPFPDQWDLPGGGREGDETPAGCALRELQEEFGLDVAAGRICSSRLYPSWNPRHLPSWFLVARVAREEAAAIRFGDEGQYWRLMPIAEFLEAQDAVGHLRDRLRDFLAGEQDAA